MKILFFVQHFYPSREIGAKRPSEMAKSFVREGHDVSILCGAPAAIFKEADSTLAHCKRTTISVPVGPVTKTWLWIKARRASRISTAGKQTSTTEHALAATSSGESLQGKFKRWYFSIEGLFTTLKLWTLKCFFPLRARLREDKPQLIITSCPPMNTALLVRLQRALGLSSCKWIIDLRDPFTTPSAPEVKSALRAYLERLVEKSCLKNCDLIVVASPGLRADVIAVHPAVAHKIQVIYNGYEGSASPPQRIVADGKTLRLLSAGTIYYNRDPRTLFDAIRQAHTDLQLPQGSIHLTLLGNCENPTRETVLQWVEDRNISPCVSLVAAVPPSELQEYFRNADILVNFAQGQHALIPAKTYEYLATGKPSLTISERDSETAKIVIQTRAGILCEPTVPEITAALKDFYRSYVVEKQSFSPDKEAVLLYSREYQNKHMLSLCQQLIGNAAGQS